METQQQNTNSLATMVADNVSAMLAYWDKDLICRFANPAYLSWFGISREDMIDKITIKELLGPLYEKNLPYIKGALNGVVQTFERQIPLPDNSGSRDSIANYYPDIVNGQVKGFFVHVADVTPLKTLQTQLLKSKEIINEQNKRLLNYSNIVTHNLKSYSDNLQSILDLINTAKSEKEKEKMFGFLSKLSKGFSSTISHLNEIVRVQNQVEIQSEQINPHDYVEKIAGMLQIQIDISKAILLNNINRDIFLMANPAYIESILVNLLTNAIKYRHPERTAIIELDSFTNGDKTVLTIKDNGQGINLEKYGSQLFGMYKTFHGNSDAQGIGLFITKYQIEAMGGEIKVDSKENFGTTFTIYFNSIS